MSSLLVYPAWLVTLVVVVVTIAVSVACQWLLVRKPALASARDNEIAGMVLQIIGLMYAVLLAFVVVSAWEALDTARQTAQREVDALGDLYRVVSAFPPAPRNRVRSDILAYARLMQTEEWPGMQHGAQSARAVVRAESIAETIDRFHAANLAQASDESEALTLLHAFLDARRHRLNTNEEGLPRVLWWALWLGAALVIGSSFMLRAQSRSRQFLMTALLAATIGLLLALALEFEYPFRGEVSASASIWTHLEQTLTSGQIR